MSTTAQTALDLCRTLLAFTAPGTAVAVPHAALAQIVELASGTAPVEAPAVSQGTLQELYDVAALARRYNRAPATVRQWFAEGLFGPPGERLFRGRGYVASAEAVRDFEVQTGVRGDGRTRSKVENPPAPDAPRPLPTSASVRGGSRTTRPSPGGLGSKIMAATESARTRERRTA
jgi:hypothetical protein